MGGHGQRARLILFLAVVLVPVVVLVVLGIRIVRNDREFRWARRAADHRQAVARAQMALSAALAPIVSGEIRDDLSPGGRYRHAETVFVGWADGDKLEVPWDPERDRVARASRAVLAGPNFAAALHACDLDKSRKSGSADPGACYQRVLECADHPAQAAYARWLRARDLSDSGRARDAARLYRELLRSPADIADESGVPLALLAAQALVRDPAYRDEVVAAVASIVDSRPWLSVMSCYAASAIASQLSSSAKLRDEPAGVSALVREIEARVRIVRRAEALQNDFGTIRAELSRRSPDAWAAFGEDPWLVAIAEPSEALTAVVVVRAEDVLRTVGIPGAVRLAGASDLEGDPLGSSFPGVKVVFSNNLSGPDASHPGLLYSALMLVVVATVFAAWLLWRDLRREVQLSEMRTQFVASVSHELKTPLTAIRMFAETLQMGRCLDRDTQDEYLGTIVNECERLSRLVDGVLRFSKGEHGKRVYRLKPLQAGDAVLAAARAMDYPLSQNGFHLHMSVRDDAPLVSADRDAIEQAVLNLLSNAMKYSNGARDIELGLYPENGDVVIRVVDHGIGIPAEEQSRIFEKFYRVPTRENHRVPGAGLGLAVVGQIVKAHGGRVDVQSAPGEGSAFLLRIPALAASRGGENYNEHHSCD